ncbi:Sulfite exporter TauE/SafE [Faunimonas pinastri]|uniref:Probable membrane transporter protein n=1 Tax=Faunimonas pinastri TaxID=1855383 RepID=A0A1H9C662_9HYPH|nr:sulfite exporter TauE/SafE family protein [Faunimonas pinastri]SEP96323.1 Sulfite exporter TauE/SafE [Faunimonas pinastri]
MSVFDILYFVLLAGIAAYVQSLTGFGLGLITMGGVALGGAIPLTYAAVLVSVMTLVNAGQVLLKGWRDVAWRDLRLVILSGIPALILGYWMLEWLAGTRMDAVRLLLGIIIILSALQLAARPHALGRRSSDGSFLFFGAVAGIMGGLFSTSGPPLVYHLYRQPMPAVTIRETLVAIFGFNALFRLIVVAGAGNLPPARVWICLLALPSVMVFTFAARRWPPPVAPEIMRHVIFVLLCLSGISLAGPGLLHLLGHPA